MFGYFRPQGIGLYPHFGDSALSTEYDPTWFHQKTLLIRRVNASLPTVKRWTLGCRLQGVFSCQCRLSGHFETVLVVLPPVCDACEILRIQREVFVPDSERLFNYPAGIEQHPRLSAKAQAGSLRTRSEACRPTVMPFSAMLQCRVSRGI